MNKIAEIKGAVPLFPEFRFARPVDWRIARGENWAVVGPNGAGKSMLADILLRRIPLKDGSVTIDAIKEPYQAVRMIGFRDIYSIVDCRESYYQQRWNADGREATPLAGSLFPDGAAEQAAGLFTRFNLVGALDKHIVSLSSGELRKLLIIRALANSPEVLIIDNPFVGLDEGSRAELSAMLGELSKSGLDFIHGGACEEKAAEPSTEGRVQFILLTSGPGEIPEWVDKVIPLRDMEVLEPMEAFKSPASLKQLFTDPEPIPQLPPIRHNPEDTYRTVALLENVTVKYGDKTILDRLDWKVARGEKWALLGPNGSGKSTLLSLLYGDNPQAYANPISLFDRRRGTGESIWDIKKRIGYLNSDIHSFYLKDITAIEVVLSGFYDTVGLYSAGTEEQTATARVWLDAFGAGHIAERKFVKLSFGQQRLVMLARTFVKSPPVVILDEPMHGLDTAKRERAGKVIARYCDSPDVTLIYVTHYPEEIPRCVGKIKCMDG